jgi:broad specificity phosphatase PhoE
MRAIFIRHGQSTGNAGMPCHDLATIELTEKGWSQARRVAADWTETPSLIVTSPFLRTQQTAAPTIERFPDVPVEVWPIEEFTYLQPSRWNGTLAADRAPHLLQYWNEADPAYCDGEGAESFGTLLRRAEVALGRLAALPSPGPVYVFSHGQFIQAVRAVVTESQLDDRGKMIRFWRKGEPPAIRNTELVEFKWSNPRWQHTIPTVQVLSD